MAKEKALRYILKGRKVVPCKDLNKWAKSLNQSMYVGVFSLNKRNFVAQDELGSIRVSTVFLGIDHNLSGKGPPLLFETMIFGGTHNDYQKRYSTYKEAEEGHKEACKLAFENIRVVRAKV